MMLRAVVFDLDDTLAVVDRDRQALLDDATDRAGAPALSRDRYLEHHDADLATETREPIFAAMLEGADADVEPGDLAAVYRDAIGEAIVPVEGAERLVRELASRYRVGLVTDGPLVAQRDKLERLGWGDLFEAVAITGTLPAGKPDERAFLAVLEELGVDPSAAVYVGDKPRADIQGATALGMRAIQVLYEGGPDPDPRADAHVRRDRLAADLPDVIESLSGRN
ncbi:HAD family hydrolase [Halobacteriales archaeon QS_1_68_17]|nr:MAG: HAD family hydrolase [Halobacteriales archaeon QS_1_68_17]